MIKKILISALLSLPIFAYSATGACIQVSSNCVDTTPSKVFGTDTVLVGDVGGCWQYDIVYDCVSYVGSNTCLPFEDSKSGCDQTSTKCIDASCTGYDKVYACAAPIIPDPIGATKLPDNVFISKEFIDDSGCTGVINPDSCVVFSDVCSGDPETRLINGLSVDRACWSYKRQSACIIGTTTTCDAKLEAGCQKIGAPFCTMTGEVGGCSQDRQNLLCPVPTSSSTQGACQAVTCIGSTCFADDRTQDSDLGKYAAANEIAQQGATYMKDLKLFTGDAERCKTETYGISSKCCESGGGPISTNQGYGQQIGISVALQAGTHLVSAGAASMSAYAYDFAMQSTASWMPQAALAAYDGLAAAAGGVASAFSGAAASAGTSAATTTAAASTAGAAAASSIVAIPGLNLVAAGATPGFFGAATATPLFSAGGYTLYFNPTTLAIAAAIYIIMEILGCDPEEKITSKKVNAKLCFLTGNYCSNKLSSLFGISVCLERKNAYCCFNSLIAKAINIAAHEQFSRGWGDVSGGNPSCAGLTIDELSALDWDKVDLEEFMEQIKAQVKEPTTDDINNLVSKTTSMSTQDLATRTTNSAP